MTPAERTCEAYRKALSSGETSADVVGRLAAEAGVQRPAIWKRLRAGGVMAPYKPKQGCGRGRPIGGGEPGYSERVRKRGAERRIAEEERLPPRIDRTPCGFCGIRADVGCKHQRAAA